MDSLLPIPTRSEAIAPHRLESPRDSKRPEDLGFAAELNRQVESQQRRSSRPPGPDESVRPEDRRAEPNPDGEPGHGAGGTERSASDSKATNAAAEARSDRPEDTGAPGAGPRSGTTEAQEASAPRSQLDARLELPSSFPTPLSGELTAAEASELTASSSPPSVAGSPPTVEGPAVTNAPKAAAVAAQIDPKATRVTEEQANAKKLTRYLVDQTASGASSKPEADRQSLTPTQPIDTSAELDKTAPAPVESSDGQLADRDGFEAELGTKSKPTKADAIDLSKPFDPAVRFRAAQAAEAQRGADGSDPARSQQLHAAAQRALAEARQKMLQPGRTADGRLQMTLNVQEASIPMRLRFSPDGHGGQQVAFLVASAKDLRELRRLMPEIESVLTELPVEVSDVQTDIDSFRDVSERDETTRRGAGAAQ